MHSPHLANDGSSVVKIKKGISNPRRNSSTCTLKKPGKPWRSNSSTRSTCGSNGTFFPDSLGNVRAVACVCARRRSPSTTDCAARLIQFSSAVLWLARACTYPPRAARAGRRAARAGHCVTTASANAGTLPRERERESALITYAYLTLSL